MSGSKRRGLKGNNKDTPESSPERTQKARSAAKARDEARKKMLAEKRAAMKQQQQQQQQQQEGAADVEIFLADSRKQWLSAHSYSRRKSTADCFAGFFLHPVPILEVALSLCSTPTSPSSPAVKHCWLVTFSWWANCAHNCYRLLLA